MVLDMRASMHQKYGKNGSTEETTRHLSQRKIQYNTGKQIIRYQHQDP